MTVINAILRFLAFVLLTLVVIALPISLVARDAGQLIFDPDTIKTLVGENLLSPEFVGQLAQRATMNAIAGAEADSPPADQATAEEGEDLDMALVAEGLSYLEEDDWSQIASLIAPEDVVSQTVDKLVDAYVAWLNSDSDFPQVVLDLRQWKLNAQQHAGEVVGIVLAALPECSAEEILNQAVKGLQEGEDLAQVAIPVCNPGEPTTGALLANADSMVSSLTEHTPDTLDTRLLQGESAPEELVRLKAALVRARLLLGWSWLAVLGFAALAVLMAARSWPQALTWAGWPLMLAGGLTLLFGLGTQFLASGGLERVVARIFADAPVTLSAIGSTVAAGVLPLVATPLLIQGGFLIALGLGGLIGSRYLRKRDEAPTITDYA